MKNECSLPLEEQLSALADGELAPDALTQLVVELSQQDTLREDWYIYHVVGDVLRSASLSPGGFRRCILESLRAAIGKRNQRDPHRRRPIP